MLSPTDVVDITSEAIWVTLKVGLPMLLGALFVGLIVSLFQALTQIQEMTLAFIPKIIAVFGIMMISLPFMMETMKTFSLELFARMVTGG